jgi:histidine triad (HIT) family protein
MEDTIFDKILSGEIPSTAVYEDDHVLAFKDLNPQAPVHVLVIPKIKAVKFSDFKDRDINEAGLFFNRVAKIAALLGLDKDGYRIIINSGKHGQQTVDYVHAHILGGRQLNWPPG